MKPIILISNDDGIASPNLRSLAAAIERAGIADVLIIAPERERSAASHAITLHKPVRIRQHGPGWYSLSGTPADCVYVGILKLCPRPPSVVVSGINRGYNLGSDVFYSGTVAAAVEGGLRGAPAVAFSIDPSPERDVEASLPFCLALIASILDTGLPAKIVLNVNLPVKAGSRYAWTRLGERSYRDDVAERSDPRGEPYYWIGGGVASSQPQPGTDCDAVTRGIVSVTPLHLDLTAQEMLSAEKHPPLDGFEHVSLERQKQ
ncbi:MAG: 5'/3'-nucleotidase SurE [Proteobacteria bacterium]|nr:5'/3'-nucleotidase SurE [Pseudomonadota bacterium]